MDAIEDLTHGGTKDPEADLAPERPAAAIEYMVALGRQPKNRPGRKIAVIEWKDGYDLPHFGAILNRPVRRVGPVRDTSSKPPRFIYVRMGPPLKHPKPGALKVRLMSAAELATAKRLGNVRPEAYVRIEWALNIGTTRGVANGIVRSVKLPQRKRSGSSPRPELGS